MGRERHTKTKRGRQAEKDRKAAGMDREEGRCSKVDREERIDIGSTQAGRLGREDVESREMAERGRGRQRGDQVEAEGD